MPARPGAAATVNLGRILNLLEGFTLWKLGTPDFENHATVWISPNIRFGVVLVDWSVAYGLVQRSDLGSMYCRVLDTCRCLTFALERSEGVQPLLLKPRYITMYMHIAFVCDGTSSTACLKRSSRAPWPEHRLRPRCQKRSSAASCHAQMTQRMWHPRASAPLPHGRRTKQKGEHHLRQPWRPANGAPPRSDLCVQPEPVRFCPCG